MVRNVLSLHEVGYRLHKLWVMVLATVLIIAILVVVLSPADWEISKYIAAAIVFTCVGVLLSQYAAIWEKK